MGTSEYAVRLRKGVYGLGIYFTESRDRAVVDPDLPFYRLPDGSQAPGEACGAIVPGDVLVAIDGKDLRAVSFPEIVEELRCIDTERDVELRFEKPPLHGQERPIAVEKIVVIDHIEIAKPVAVTEEAVAEDNQQAHEHEQSERINKSAKSPSSSRWKLLQQRVSATAAAVLSSQASTSPQDSAMAVMNELLAEMELKLASMEEAIEREKKCRFLAEKKNILYRTELLRLTDENSALRHQLAQEQRRQTHQEAFYSTLHLAI